MFYLYPKSYLRYSNSSIQNRYVSMPLSTKQPLQETLRIFSWFVLQSLAIRDETLIPEKRYRFRYVVL